MMEKLIDDMKRKGKFLSLISMIESENIEIANKSYLGSSMNIASQNGVTCHAFVILQILDTAVDAFEVSDHRDWAVAKMKEMAEDDCIKVRASSAELGAAGILKEVFDGLRPMQEKRKKKTPDFEIHRGVYAEVYCPQESQPEKQKVKREIEKQQGMVRIAFSHPLTGSNGMSLRYPANKMIDKVVNQKRDNEQTVEGARNLLWIDLLQSYRIPATKLRPTVSEKVDGNIYIKSFGIWNAFYGKEDDSILPREPMVLRYLTGASVYFQRRNGIFRNNRNWSGALLLTKDGLVFFENPWAKTKVGENTMRRITKLFMFRPEFSFFDFPGNMVGLENQIESELERMKWLYQC
ncbi:MAG: hypothetical protein GY854_20140 [Deltaproteobacteria bacterium]|nr:hypothetical protein [Deltaproteobacteria bacterium]